MLVSKSWNLKLYNKDGVSPTRPGCFGGPDGKYKETLETTMEEHLRPGHKETPSYFYQSSTSPRNKDLLEISHSSIFRFKTWILSSKIPLSRLQNQLDRTWQATVQTHVLLPSIQITPNHNCHPPGTWVSAVIIVPLFRIFASIFHSCSRTWNRVTAPRAHNQVK